MKCTIFLMTALCIFQASALTVNIDDYGAAGDGATDDTAAFNNAVNAVYNSGGGTVLLNAHQQYYLANTPVIKAGVHVEGEWVNVGHYTASILDELGSCLLLNPSKKLFMYNGSSLQGVMVLNANITPSVADDSSFSGTAIALYGNGITVKNCAIMGFDIGIWGPSSYDNSNCTLEYLNLDNSMLLDINNSSSGLQLKSVHGLCWLTEGDTAHPLDVRSGTAFSFEDVHVSHAINCFAIYSKDGYDIEDCSTMYFEGCGIDYSRSESNGTGWNIHGDSDNIYLFGCQAASMDRGVLIDLDSSSSNVEMRCCEVWNVKDYAVRCLSGTVNVNCSYFRGDATAWSTLDALVCDGTNAVLTSFCSSFEYFRYAHRCNSGTLTQSTNISATDSRLTAMAY